jgi:hypothetical protein
MDQAAVEQMAAQMHQMQGALQVLMAQQAHPQPPGAVAGPPRASAPRIPPPPPFDGRAAKLDSWLLDLEGQYDFYAMGQDAERLRLATGFLAGAARDWWVHTDAAARPTSWANFVASLRKEFQPVTSAETARAKILALSQGKASVNEYIAAFRRLLIAVPDMAESDRLFQFTRGLRPQIAMQLRMQGVATVDAAITAATRIGSAGELAGLSAFGHLGGAPMELDSIEEWSQTSDASDTSSHSSRVSKLEENMQEMLAYMREQRTGGSSSSSRGGLAPRGGSSSANHRLRGLPRIPHLSPNEVKEYMDAGKCFGCGSKEHQSRQCPKRKEGAGQAN